MANQIAMMAGKRFLSKKLADDSKDSGDAYKYLDKYGKKHKKTQKYFEQELGIPREDAALLFACMKRARTIEGIRVGPFRFGPGFFVGFVPGIGDAIDGLLAMTVVKKCSGVSGGLDKGIREKMIMNVIIDVLIGITPVLGDFADSVYQANTRNVKLLEKMLVKRVRKELEMAIDAEEKRVAPMHDHSQASSREHSRAPTRKHTQMDGHYDQRSRNDSPPGHDNRHAGMQQRLQAKESQKSTMAKPSQGGNGGWLNRLASGGRDDDAAPERPPRSTNRRMDDDREYAPSQPPRPNQARHHQVGSF